MDIVTNGCNIREDESQKACPMTAIVFAGPRVGDSDFEEFSSSEKDLRILRIRIKEDFVPRHPFLGYKEVGEELEIDQNNGLVQQLDGTWKMEEPESDSEDDVF
ncbi:hypothetical protein K1719_032543 [Acacia pycnantha]|nr:hypothetical protein K1719_039007 [Acacia pycnantha]KAI9085476.1 hypothetical protein K1719_032543 [Acacia pycnantha]